MSLHTKTSSFYAVSLILHVDIHGGTLVFNGSKICYKQQDTEKIGNITTKKVKDSDQATQPLIYVNCLANQ